MRCKNCNGDLVIQDGVWLCKSCGAKFSINEYLEENEVYICYLESDENGRRTKDSSVAQELYQILEGRKIKTFYKRISLAEFSGETAQAVDDLSISYGKVFLLVATTKDSFSSLWENYKDKIAGRKIIPVYADMNAGDLPEEIRTIQSLNYNSVGISADLVRTVLKALGKQEEDDFVSLNKKQNNKKGVLLIAVIAAVLLMVIVGVAIISKRNTAGETDTHGGEGETDAENINGGDASAPEVENEEAYLLASECIENKEYADAIDLLAALGDYKDSESLLHTCYMKYAGYYVDEESSLCFRLQIYEKNNGEIEIYQIDKNGEKCSANESFSFQGCTVTVAYTDSEKNTGNVSIELENASIIFTLESSDITGDLHIADGITEFGIDEKTDQPLLSEVSSDFYKQILDGTTTISDIQRKGYDISYYKEFVTENMEFGNIDVGGQMYRFDNTDIYVIAFDYDIAKYKWYDADRVIYDEPVVCVVQGPAAELAPNKIGDEAIPFVEDDCLYCPNFIACNTIERLEFMQNYESEEIIDENTVICVCSKETVGETRFSEMFSEYSTMANAEYSGQNFENDNGENSSDKDVFDICGTYQAEVHDGRIDFLGYAEIWQEGGQLKYTLDAYDLPNYGSLDRHGGTLSHLDGGFYSGIDDYGDSQNIEIIYGKDETGQKSIMVTVNDLPYTCWMWAVLYEVE